MNMLFVIGGVGRFFKASGKRIICIPKRGYVTLRGRVRGGFDYWRGQVDMLIEQIEAMQEKPLVA